MTLSLSDQITDLSISITTAPSDRGSGCIQGRIYSKPGPVQIKMWGLHRPRAPNTITGILLLPTVPSITSLPDCAFTLTHKVVISLTIDKI